jgi:hypothetical protein
VPNGPFSAGSLAGGGFRWYPRTVIAGLRFEPGQTSNALHVMLTDGNRVELDWLSVDGGEPLIEEWAAGTA